MAQDFATLDPDMWSVTFGGYSIGGFAQGTMIRVSNLADAFTDRAGATGLVTRSKTNDRRGNVTILLEQTSQSNLVLSTLHVTDLEASNGAGVAPLFIRDRQGPTVYQAARAWIVKAPDADIAQEGTVREWLIRCAKIRRVDGGN